MKRVAIITAYVTSVFASAGIGGSLVRLFEVMARTQASAATYGFMMLGSTLLGGAVGFVYMLHHLEKVDR